MSDFVNSSALTKLLANLFIFLVLTCALGIAAYDTIYHFPIDPYITTLIGGGLTYAVGLIGVHIGGVQALQSQVSLSNNSAMPADQQQTAKMGAVK